MEKTDKTVVDLSKLISKFNDVMMQSDGDVARVIELLLLENHILTLHQSSGLTRGLGYDFSQYPRFLSFDQDADDVSESDATLPEGID